MLDMKFIREEKDLVKKDLEKRQEKDKLLLLKNLLKKDEEWRKLKKEVDELRHRRNQISQQINKLKKEGKKAEKELKEAKAIPKKIIDTESKTDLLRKEMHDIQMRLPNIMHESVPYGKDDTENKVVRTWGKIKKPAFELKPHGELMEELGVAEFDRAAKISGKGFYYLLGDLVLLDQALLQFAISKLVKKGYTPVQPPYMMRTEAYEGVIDLADFETMMYKIQDQDLHLIATSEHPMGAIFMNEVLEPKKLPIKLGGISPCFRKEIGSHGVDEKGIFRVHQFNKIEMFIFCKPEDSWKHHEELIANAEEIFQELELPYRIVNICTGDLGIVAAKKYDLELWMPREEKYKEAVSCSNCTAYQATRLNIRYRTGEGNKFVHTLNSTLVTDTRPLRAIFEHHQNKDGSVNIPKALHPYMYGKKKITLQRKW
ncbi:serine--tRNA ligase [Candidatus Woesearchaeota archaeon]|nr:serine--tRNA ligase [Candidatus Woesearchaeota archaeon]